MLQGVFDGYDSTDVTILSTANESLDGIIQTTTIVKRYSKGHIASCAFGN